MTGPRRRQRKETSLGQCKICDQTFEVIPEDAVKLGTPWYRFQLYRFADGVAHHIRIANPKKKLETEAIPATPEEK